MISIPVLLAIVFVSATIQAILGFGFGMVAMAFVPFLVDLKLAVPLVSFICLMMNSSLLVHLRGHVDRSKFLPLVFGGVVGVPCGVLALRTAPEAVLTLSLGLVIGAFVVRSAWEGDVSARDLGVGWGYLAGFAGGALGGAFNTGGAPPVMYASRKPWTPDALKANLQVFFCGCSLLQVSLFLSSGLLGWDILVADLVALPAVLCGIGLGSWWSRRLDGDSFRKWVLSGLAVMALVYVYQGLTAL